MIAESSRSPVVGVIVRHHNDIDHITPIVYKMLEQKRCVPKVFSVNPFLPIGADFRLNYLRQEYGCRVSYAYEIHQPRLLHRLFCLLVCRLPNTGLISRFRWTSKLARLLAQKLTGMKASGRIRDPSSLQSRLYETVWWMRALEKEEISYLVIDLGDVDRFTFPSLRDAARALQVPVVGVPHGVDLIINDDYLERSKSSGQGKLALGRKYAWLDRVIVQADVIKDKYVRNGVSAEKVLVLGSTRFCKEWMAVYHSIVPPQDLPAKDGKLKVVYFDHVSSYRMNVDAIVETMQVLSKADSIELIVKPSTRGPLSDGRVAQYAQIDLGTFLVNLIRWSDVVISTVSSIVLEAYYQEKPFVYPAFCTENHMLFQDYGACWVVSDVRELLAALHALHEKGAPLPYSADAVRAFQDAVVYGGNPGRDVLADYVDAILASRKEGGPNEGN